MSRTLSRLLAALALLAAVLGSAPARTASAFSAELTNLRTFGSHASAVAVNDSGMIVGYAWLQPGRWHAVRWDVARKLDLPVDLGTLGGPNSVANAVNDSGQIVGVADTATTFPNTNVHVAHAALWENGTVVDLGVLVGGFASSATGINDAGLVVGYSGDELGFQHAVVWMNTPDRAIIDLGTLGGRAATAVAINNLDQVVGWANTDAGHIRATLWDLRTDQTIDLGTLGGSFSQATAINDASQVTGYSATASGQLRAFIWDQQTGMHELGTLGGSLSLASGINDAGQVVGVATDPDGLRHAVVWEDGAIVDVQDAVGPHGYVSLQPLDINNAGAIVGTGHAAFGNWGPILIELSSADTTAPVLNLPEILEVNATSPEGAVVDYAVTSNDDLDPAPQVACEPQTGSTFPTGTTEVNCTATDASGNSSSGLFSVTVRGGSEQIDDLIDMVESFNLRQGIANALDAKLDNAREALAAAEAGDTEAACSLLGAFVNHVAAQSGKALTLDQASQLVQAAEQIRAVLGCS